MLFAHLYTNIHLDAPPFMHIHTYTSIRACIHLRMYMYEHVNKHVNVQTYIDVVQYVSLEIYIYLYYCSQLHLSE